MLNFILGLQIKEALEKAWAFVKRYWQFFLGLSVGLIVLAVSRDSRGIANAFKKFKESSDEMNQNSLEIERQQDEKALDVIDEFTKEVREAEKEHKDSSEKIENESRDRVSNLLEEESESRGTIADKINDHLK